MSLNRLLSRMASSHALGILQSDPAWLARYHLRPDYEPIVLRNRTLQELLLRGVRNFVSAQAFVQSWVKLDEPDKFDVFGTRDMCWHLSWLLEILEGRYEDEIADEYEPNFYLRCRYGVNLYFTIDWNQK